MSWGVTVAEPKRGWGVGRKPHPPGWGAVGQDVPTPPAGAFAGRVGFNSSFRLGQQVGGYWGWQPDMPAEFAALVEAGVTTMREVCEWRFIETADGVFDWSKYDAIMDAAADAGIDWVWCPSTTPEWARPGGAGAHYNTPPSDATHFADFCVALLDRYGPGGEFWAENPGLTPKPVQAIELWNEPWLWFGWQPDPAPAAYAALALEAAQAIRVAHPTVTILGVGDPYVSTVGGDTTSPFFTAVLDAQPTLANFVDGWAIHPYVIPAPNGPDSYAGSYQFFYDRVSRMRDIARVRGVEKPVWITEVGWTNATSDPKGVSEATAATFIRRALERALIEWKATGYREGVERIYIHTYWRSIASDLTNVEGNYAVMRADGSYKPLWDELRDFLGTLPAEEPPPVEDVPFSIDGLVAVLDAGEVGVADGAAVSTWPDAAGTNDFAQANVTLQPTLATNVVNGRPVVRFTGTDRLDGPDLLSGATEGEIFAVLKADADPPSAGNSGLWRFSIPGAPSAAHYVWSDGTLYETFGSNARKTVGNPTPALTAWRVYNVASKSGEFTARLDGTQLMTTATNTVSFNASTPWIGQSDTTGGVYYFDGDMAEVIVFDRVLTAGERDEVEAYLAAKYALTVA